MRIAILEDDPSQLELLSHWLKLAGHHAHTFEQGSPLLRILEHESFDALLLDWNVPDLSGVDVLKRVRQRLHSSVPVLFVTARNREDDVVTALREGADDYMVKPFDLRELAARLHALVRRTQGRAAQVIQAGPLRLEPDSGLAWLEDQSIVLTRREIDLLAHLANTGGRWLTPEMLHERLYGLAEPVSSNALNVHIHNLRRKLGGDVIETSRGLGYRLGWTVV